jgi:hypothetical protein
MMTPEEVAAGIADAAEAPTLPLRIPLGQVAAEILAVRRAAPDDRPFIPAHPRRPGHSGPVIDGSPGSAVP